MAGKGQEEFLIPKNFTEAKESPGGGAALPINGLMGMCRWMGSHFHDWPDYNGGRLFKHFL